MGVARHPLGQPDNHTEQQQTEIQVIPQNCIKKKTHVRTNEKYSFTQNQMLLNYTNPEIERTAGHLWDYEYSTSSMTYIFEDTYIPYGCD